MVDKYGFVYIWFDRKHKRYYVGCHWGREDDGYICSSNWMRDAYRRRPEDFKRRIIKTNMDNKRDMLLEEQRYFKMIKPEELKIKYYNLCINFEHWLSKDDMQVLTIRQKISNSTKGRTFSEETRQKLREAHKGKLHGPLPIETRNKMRESRKGKSPSEETKRKISQTLIGQSFSEERKEKISISNKGHKHSENAKKQMSETHTGKKHSAETRRKMSESARTSRGRIY